MKNILKSCCFLACMFFLTASCERGRYTQLSPDQNAGVTDIEILIGSSLALEGHADYLGTQTLHGALSYLNYVNENGGIHG